MSDNDIFQQAKQFDIADYIESYGVELRRNGNSECPFCGHKNFSVKRDKQFFKCFSSDCDKGGDIITFCKLINNIDSNLEAAKKILTDNGVYVENYESKETKEQVKKRIEEAKKRREEEAKKDAKDREFASIEMGKIYKNLLDAARRNVEKVKLVFPHYDPDQFKLFSETIGYCEKNESVVIVNKDKDKVYNIKYREKFYKNGKRKEGKWHSTYNSTQHPFPIEFFREDNNFVFLCEGEKDAINLRQIGANVLTLGGVGLSWNNHKHLLKGKNVIIFFDHDRAGYVGAIKRYNEIKDVAASVSFILFFYLKGSQCPKGYDLSDWMKENGIFVKFNSVTEKTEAFERFLKLTKYATFKACQATLGIIADWERLTDSEREGLGIEKPRSVEDVFPIWSKNAIKPKFDMEDVEPILMQLGNEHKEYAKQEIRELLKEASPEIKEFMARVLSVKKTMLATYCKMGRSDLWKAFLEMTKISDHTIVRDVKTLYVWDGKSFIKLDDDMFIKYCMSEWFYKASVQSKSHHKDTATFLLNDISAHADNIDSIKARQKKRAYSMENGTYIISEFGKCSFVPEHRKDFYCLNSLDFAYNEKADCPKWKAMIERVLPDEKERQALQEFFGYCLYPKHDYETFLFLFGESGANGKSVILDVLSSFFGEDNVSHLQMQSLKGHELHALKNKVLNIGSEVDASSAAEGAQNLKVLVSAKDLLEVNPKNKDNYVLRKNMQPKMAFSGNKKPTGGIDNGIFRRMLMIRFDEKINDDEKIYNISERFIDEMDGIFNWAIQGLERLVKNKKFTKSDKMIADIEEYKDEQDPMRVFLKDHIKASETQDVYKDVLYKAYESWAREKGHQPLANTRFFPAFKQKCLHNGIKIEEVKPKDGKRYIKGIILVDIEQNNGDYQ